MKKSTKKTLEIVRGTFFEMGSFGMREFGGRGKKRGGGDKAALVKEKKVVVLMVFVCGSDKVKVKRILVIPRGLLTVIWKHTQRGCSLLFPLYFEKGERFDLNFLFLF